MYSVKFSLGDNPNGYYKCGLYLVACVCYSYDMKELLYWVKVGKSNNLSRRIKEYLTHHPMLERIDYKNVHPSELSEREQEYHEILWQNCRFSSAEAQEWFCVDKKIYKRIKKYGFDCLNRL